MLITEIRQVNSRKFSFKIVEGENFFLTSTELSDYRLKKPVFDMLDGEKVKSELEVNLPDSVYKTICTETIIPRGERYALSLLSDREYSEFSLKKKLLETGYSENHAEQILDYVKSFNYLDDERYACTFIRNRLNSKSRRYLEQKLLEKGVSKETIQNAFLQISEENDEGIEAVGEREKSIITKTLNKKLKGVSRDDRDKLTKITSSLLRQGFKYSDINEAINEFYSNLM